jgi:hypothetical protein
MTSCEHFHQPEKNRDITYTLALFLSGKIRREDMAEENQTVLSFYLGLMADYHQFAQRVNSLKNQLMTNGQKIPLYSEEEIKRMKKYKKRHRKKDEPQASQLSFWSEKNVFENEEQSLKIISDPEKTLFQEGEKLESRFFPRKKLLITKEVREKKLKLREMIGLPVARGKNPHVNDRFYKFLVRNICQYDEFEIFREYDRVLDELPEDLSLKIKEVSDLVEQLLNNNLNRNQKYNTFKEFVRDYHDRWNNPK